MVLRLCEVDGVEGLAEFDFWPPAQRPQRPQPPSFFTPNAVAWPSLRQSPSSSLHRYPPTNQPPAPQGLSPQLPCE
eukprot:gene8312-1483_t